MYAIYKIGPDYKVRASGKEPAEATLVASYRGKRILEDLARTIEDAEDGYFGVFESGMADHYGLESKRAVADEYDGLFDALRAAQANGVRVADAFIDRMETKQMTAWASYAAREDAEV
jgi:hypothetical protein